MEAPMIDASIIAAARAVPIVHEIHRRGIHLRRVGIELVGSCPRCGDGGKGIRSNRFAVHLRKHVWICRQCRAGGDVIDMVQHLDGVQFAEAVARLVGNSWPASTPRCAPVAQPATNAPLPLVDDEKRSRRYALRWWEEAGPIWDSEPAMHYLTAPKDDGGRALALPPDISPRALRFHSRCIYGKDESGADRYVPAIVALFRDISTDDPRAIHRIALTPDGRKIGRMMLGPVDGAAIKITADEDVTMALTVGEGLETALAGMVFGFAPAWALGSADAIRKFPTLSGVDALTILGEPGDANARAVMECFDRWSAAGREVFRTTSTIGGDLNDALMVA
jgi:hypothetical protein